MSGDRPFLELLAKIDGGSMCCLKCHEVYAQFQPTPTLEEALEMHYYAEHE